MNPLDRILLKTRVIASFFGGARTPIALTIDSLKLALIPMEAKTEDAATLFTNKQ
jgi:hypothetical protein